MNDDATNDGNPRPQEPAEHLQWLQAYARPADFDSIIAEAIDAPPANYIAPPPPPPRIWSALVVGILILPLAIMVSLAVFVAALVLSLGPNLHPSQIEPWMRDFTETRIGLLVMVLPGQLTFLGVAILAARLSPVPFRERLRLTRGKFPLWTWPVLALATPAIGFLTSMLMSAYFDDMGEQLELMENMFRSHKGAFALVVVGLVAVLPGLSEEMLFRGYVQSRLLQRLPPLAAIGITSVLFAAAHIDPLHVLAVIPLGIWLGVVAWKADSIWPSVLCHMVNNALSIIMTHYSDPEGFDVDLDPPTIIALSMTGTALVLSMGIMWAYGSSCADSKPAKTIA